MKLRLPRRKPAPVFPSGEGVDYPVWRAYARATDDHRVAVILEQVRLDAACPLTGDNCRECGYPTQADIRTNKTFCASGCTADNNRLAGAGWVAALFDAADTANIADSLADCRRVADKRTAGERGAHDHVQSLKKLRDELAAQKPPVTQRHGLRCEPDGFWVDIDLPRYHDSGPGAVRILRRGTAQYKTDTVEELPLHFGEPLPEKLSRGDAWAADLAAIDELRARCARLNDDAALHSAAERGEQAFAAEEQLAAAQTARAVNAA